MTDDQLARQRAEIRQRLDDLHSEIRQVGDPLERAKLLTTVMDDMGAVTTSYSETRQGALVEAKEVKGMTQADIAKQLGLTPARINQMLKARATPLPERALLAPDAGVPIAVAVVEKRDDEKRRVPTIAISTQAAVAKLGRLATDLNLPIKEDPEVIPPPGLVDLNRNNLAVLIGPRISSLIAQIVAGDPVIQWRQDKRGNWYLIDTKTGAEHHSDFDYDFATNGQDEGHCIAQIGRIRRPDGHGSFLYLGGAHTPGTAGAVDVFVREYTSIWEQAKRSLWSAIVVTKADSKGKLISAELVTPIYVHGKR